MKNITLFIAVLMTVTNVFSQTPQKMSYQAVIRTNNNTLLINKLVGMKISVVKSSSNGASVYVETQTPTTNPNGLITIEIGTGAVVSGSFSSINWADGPYFLKTETDPTGGSAYSIGATSELLSVPYALYAGNVIDYAGGTGISVNSNTISNTAPDQTVSIAGQNGTSVTGTYPNFTVSSPVYTGSTGISITGSTISNTAPDRTVSITGQNGTSVTGTYPNFNVSSAVLPKIVSGSTGGGMAPVITSGSGFYFASVGAGRYNITFDVPFSNMPTIIGSVNNSNNNQISLEEQIKISDITTTGFSVITLVGSGTSLLTLTNNIPFSFIAIGQ